MSNKNEELAIQNSGFLALADFNMNESMAEELEGLEGGFDRIRIPAGGATMYELPGDEADEPEAVKEFSAVILYHHPVLQYYKEKYTGGSNPARLRRLRRAHRRGRPRRGLCEMPRISLEAVRTMRKPVRAARPDFPAAGGRAVPADPLPAHRLYEGVFPVHQAAAQ